MIYRTIEERMDKNHLCFSKISSYTSTILHSPHPWEQKLILADDQFRLAGTQTPTGVGIWLCTRVVNKCHACVCGDVCCVLFLPGSLTASPRTKTTKIPGCCSEFRVRCRAWPWTGSTTCFTGPAWGVQFTLACWTVRLNVRWSQGWRNLLRWRWILSAGVCSPTDNIESRPPLRFTFHF